MNSTISHTKGMQSPIRRWWYIYYRQVRIIRRETLKAWEDMILFGTGCVLTTNEPDYIQHVPIDQIVFKSGAKG